VIEPAWILYVLAGAIAALFWRQVRGLSFEELLDRSAREHEAVKRVFARHPRGGAWPQFRSWFEHEEKEIARESDADLADDD